jgi:NAD(P) transhydrogenase subunit alpha
MSAEYQKKQAERLKEAVAASDIVITTALIPGKAAPKLISKAMVAGMKPGSVIVDTAIENGGNCEGSKLGKLVTLHGVKILGYPSLACRLARDASQLLARNILSLVTLMLDDKAMTLRLEDDIIKAMLVVKEGRVVHPDFWQVPTQFDFDGKEPSQ